MNIPQIIFLLCLAHSGCLANGNVKYRLPEEVVPISYALKLKPFIPEGYFEGETLIQIKVLSTVEAIYVHGSSLNLSEVKILGDLEKISFHIEDEFELIKLEYENGDNLTTGDYMIYFKYNGTLLHADQMGLVKGMYPLENKTEALVISDFQPTYARRAYPCFDEPALKATFNVTLITPDSSWIALSNSDEIEHEETQEGIVYRFETTPRMSTELTSFAITKMGCIENLYSYNAGRKLNIRSFLANYKNENQTFVLNFADKCIRYFEEFTGIEYPMSKIDFIEYDKKFTATEYWGLTSFKRGLLNPSSDIYDTRQISIIVAHELTHYWFGNLVTNRWWNDIWLQEGFAQYLSHKVVDAILNKTNVEEYPLDYTIDVLREDMNAKEVNPVVTNCTTPKDIMVRFNDITYVKAGSIIRLLDYLTGDQGFRKIIRKFFKDHLFDSATTENFITNVEATFPNSNLRDFLQTWLLQNRYPIISIEEDLTRNQYVLRQESASVFKDSDDMSPYGYKWTIPIIYTTSLDKNPRIVWFKKEEEFLHIPRGTEDFIKLNYNFMGIYLTNYSASLWNNIIEHVQILNEIEQMELVLEAEQLFEADVINCDISLRLLPRINLATVNGGYSPLRILFDLKDNLKFDESAIALLRKLYFSIRAKSEMSRKEEELSTNVISKSKRSVTSKETSNNNNRINNTSAMESLGWNSTEEKPHPRYIRCSKWIHENLGYLL